MSDGYLIRLVFNRLLGVADISTLVQDYLVATNVYFVGINLYFVRALYLYCGHNTFFKKHFSPYVMFGAPYDSIQSDHNAVLLNRTGQSVVSLGSAASGRKDI